MRKFSPEERGIFSYFDPDKSVQDDGMVWADPFDIEERWKKAKLNQTSDIDNDFNNLGLNAEGYDPESDAPDPYENVKMKSLLNLLPFSHEVFRTKPVDYDVSGLKFA